MREVLWLLSILLAQGAPAQVYCIRAIGHTPQHERIFFQKGSGDLGPAPVFPEAVETDKRFANLAAERTAHLYTSCLPDVPVADLRLQCSGNLLSQSDVFALLSGTAAVPRNVWTNHAAHVGGRYIFSLIGSGNKRYVMDLRDQSTAIVFFPDGTYQCVMDPHSSCATIPWRQVMDLTTDQPATCELHSVPMTNKIVQVSYGMDRSARARQMREARPTLFPHADEMYNSGFCMQPNEKQARVFICSKCSEARNTWLSAHPRGSEASD
jgi:hypothetical protein